MRRPDGELELALASLVHVRTTDPAIADHLSGRIVSESVSRVIDRIDLRIAVLKWALGKPSPDAEDLARFVARFRAETGREGEEILT